MASSRGVSKGKHINDDDNCMTIHTNSNNSIIELNVGGIYYTTLVSTLISEPDTLFSYLFKNEQEFIRDHKNRIFFDRDGILFRYVLDYMRNKSILLPENFHEKRRLKREAEYFNIKSMVKELDDLIDDPYSLSLPTNALQIRNAQQQQILNDADKERTQLSFSANSIMFPSMRKRSQSGSIVIGYRGTFAFGREGLSDVKFRKISRILVCGRVQLCREVFGDTLNESRDPDHGVSDRYTSRYFLKHTFLEQAFDTLTDAGFFLVGTCATGTNSPYDQFNKAAGDCEESRWLHYNEFVFFRA